MNFSISAGVKDGAGL